MDSYPTEPKHIAWMAEWIRREGLVTPWPQSVQPSVPEASGAFIERDDILEKEESKSLLERDQTATSYDQEPGFPDFDIMGPSWIEMQNGNSPMGAPLPSRRTPTAPLPEVPVESDEEVTDEEAFYPGAEGQHRGGGCDPSFISPSKRPRYDDGHYTRLDGPAPTNRSQLMPLDRKIKNLPRRVRSAHNLRPQGGIQLQGNPGAHIYRTATEMYGAPPATRTRIARSNQ